MFKLIAGAIRERRKAATRSPHWAKARADFLKTNSTCAACGSTLLLQVHHVVPFHERPALELDPHNFITLCLWRHCHIEIGHGDSYAYVNPDVRRHAELLLDGAERDTVVAAARVGRLLNAPEAA